MIFNDVDLFKIALYREFVRNGHIDTSTPFWKNPLLIAGVVAGALTGPFAFMGLVGLLGFGAGGIASGSFAAWFMSLYGGAVSSGSVCAILQSIGAAGLGATGVIATGSAGAAAGAAIANGIEVIDEEFYEKNKLSESEERSLENFLKIEQSDSNTIIFNFRIPILERKFIDTLLQVLIVVIPFASSKRFVFKYRYFGNNFTLSNYILDKLRETYGNLYVSEGIILDLSTYEFEDEHELISDWRRRNNQQ